MISIEFFFNIISNIKKVKKKGIKYSEKKKEFIEITINKTVSKGGHRNVIKMQASAIVEDSENSVWLRITSNHHNFLWLGRQLVIMMTATALAYTGKVQDVLTVCIVSTGQDLLGPKQLDWIKERERKKENFSVKTAAAFKYMAPGCK